MNVAHRINLGLIPSSELSWPIACRVLRADTGGWLHVHGNVDSNHNKNSKDEEKIETESERNKHDKVEWREWAKYARSRIESLLNERTESTSWTVSVEHIEHVKSYGPRVDHLVLDILCRPNTNRNETVSSTTNLKTHRK